MDEKEAEARPLMGTIFLVYRGSIFYHRDFVVTVATTMASHLL